MNGGITLRRFVIRGALPVLAATLMLAGCGGSSSSSSAGATSSASGSSSTAPAGLSAFQTCLKQHGVKINPGQFSGRPRASFSPGAVPTGSPRPRPSFSGSAAFKACAKYAPAGFGAGFGRAISSSALAAFKSCLSQNGVKVTGTTASAVLGELRNSTGKTAAAVRTCRVLLQPAAPTPSPST
jgi:ABC-type phosphate transport system substrate-binding protein